MNKEIVNPNLVKENTLQEELLSIDKNYFSKIINLTQNFAEIEYRPNEYMVVTGFPRARFYFVKMKNINFNFNQGELEISAKNLDNSEVVFPLHQKSNRKASFSTDGKMLQRVLNSLPSGEIKMSLIKREEKGAPSIINNYLQIKSDKFTADFRAKWDILTELKNDYLILTEKEPLFSVRSSDFLKACQKVVFAGYEEKDFYKNPDRTRFSVRFQMEKNELLLAGTDGYRLSIKKIEGIENNGQDLSFNVPKHTMIGLMKFLEGSKKNLNHSLKVIIDGAKGNVFFSHPEFRMKTPLINIKSNQGKNAITIKFATINTIAKIYARL